MVTIDGSFGEGGGQILRSTLALSILTKTPVRIFNIRAGRKKPGLLRQHLTAVNAAVEISRGNATGAAIGSRDLTFVPGSVAGGNYHFAIGSAGSAMLVLQTILFPLVFADSPSQVTLEGGTHNPWAPPYPFVEKVYLPLLKRMGADVEMNLERPGFFPAGGGRVIVKITPCDRLTPLCLPREPVIKSREAWACVSDLKLDIAKRELNTLETLLGLEKHECRFDYLKEGYGPGNIASVFFKMHGLCEMFSGFGEVRKPAKRVAKELANEVKEWLSANVPVGPYLADQLLLPMALSGKGEFITMEPTLHTKTNAEVICKFLSVKINLKHLSDQQYQITIR